MNKPVAWMYRMKNASNKWELIFNKPMSDEFFETIPLYTHPHSEESVKVKALTDEEIEEFAYAFQLWQLHNPDKVLEGIMDFARAILRKAQEK